MADFLAFPEWTGGELGCRTNSSWFFPEAWHDSSLLVRRARAECAKCPVRRQCLEWALTDQWTVGIPVWSPERDRIEFDYQTRSTRESKAVLAGTTPQEREAVAHLPLSEQVEILSEQFRHKVRRGPWANVLEEEWVAS